MRSLSPGERLGPYEILGSIGSGGMGQVYRARGSRIDRVVAIKTSADQFCERFEREARAIGQLNHPHICQLYDVGPDFLVMEYVEGTPLSRYRTKPVRGRARRPACSRSRHPARSVVAVDRHRQLASVASEIDVDWV